MHFLYATVMVFSLFALNAQADTQYYEHVMADGNSVIFLTGRSGLNGVYHVGPQSLATLIDFRHAYIVGTPTGITSAEMVLSNAEDVKFGQIYMQTPQDLAFGVMNNDVLFINSRGDHLRLTFIPPTHTPIHKWIIVRSEVRKVAGREYLFFGMSTSKQPEIAATAVISTDLRHSWIESVSAATLLHDPDPIFTRLFQNMVEQKMYAAAGQTPSDVSPLKVDRHPIPAQTIRNFKLTSESNSGDARRETPKSATSTQNLKLNDAEVLDVQGKTVSAVELVRPFVTDLTEESIQPQYSALEGEPGLMRKIIEILAGKQAPNVILTGLPGTGKTTEAQILAREIALGRAPDFLKGYRVLSVGARSLEAGGSYVGAVATKIEAMIALSRVNKIIWFIDEIHALRGIGSHSTQPLDITEQLKPVLADGTTRVFGASTPNEVASSFAGRRPFLERFTILEKKEPIGESLRKAIFNWAKGHGFNPPTNTVIDEIIRITDDFDGIGAQPRKAIKLLDGIYARIKIEGMDGVAPTLPDVYAVAADRLGYDKSLTDRSQAKVKLENLTQALDTEIIGQDEAKAVLLGGTKSFLAGTHNRSQPRLKVLFTGPEGQGKTSLAIAYAVAMGLPFEVIEMSQFAGGTMTGKGPLAQAAAAVAKNAFTVLIFDEIEKCSVTVQDELLRTLQEGRTTLTREIFPGQFETETVDFRNTVVFFTANAGAEHFMAKPQMGFVDRKDLSGEEVRSLVMGGNISRYMLDRVDHVLALRPLSQPAFEKAAEKYVRRLLEDLHKRQIEVVILNQAEYLKSIAAAWTPGISNREIGRLVSHLREAVADMELANGSDVRKAHRVKFKGGRFIPDCEDELTSL